MKHVSAFLVTLIMVSFTSIYAQCDPDTANCKDEGDPGEFCPEQLPVATVNQEYVAIITVITPDSAATELGTVGIDHILVDTVENFPPGIHYEANAEKFYADSAYCIRVFGIPTIAGSYPLRINITALIKIGGQLIPNQVIDSTSVIMLVQNASGIIPEKANEFKVLPNIPNPFLESTRLSFYTPFDQVVELRVYNILGELLHHEYAGYPPGEHSFGYDGSGLQPGTYIYRVTGKKEFFTGKFIKARM